MKAKKLHMAGYTWRKSLNVTKSHIYHMGFSYPVGIGGG